MYSLTTKPPLLPLASFVSIILFILLFSFGAHKPLHLDSMDFAASATAITESGKPVYYRGEWNSAHVGLWHPPLYLHLLAGWFGIFGNGVTQGRMFGMLCAILQGLTALWIVQTLFGRLLRARVEPWFWAIYLLNPYTIQTAAILDIDSTIYGPILCLTLLAALRLTWNNGEPRTEEPSRMEYFWLAFAIAVALWAKMTTILLVVPFVGLLLIARFGFWRATRITALVAGGGTAIFVSTYFAYGALLQLDIKSTFSFLLFSFNQRGSSGKAGLGARFLDYRNNAIAMVPFMIRWTGFLPWLMLAGAIGATGWIAVLRKNLRAQHYFLVLFLSGATTLYYCAQTQTFGIAPFKYTFVFWALVLTAPVLIAAGGPWRQETDGVDVDRQSRGTLCAFAVLFLVAVLYGRYQVGDKQLTQFLIFKTENLLPAAMILPAIYMGFRGGRVSSYARFTCLAGIVLWAGLGLGIAIQQSQVPYSTTYDYGQTGMEDAAAFIRMNTSPEDVISSMKDLGYLAGRRYYENYIGLFAGPESTQRFIDVLAAGKVKYAVFTTRGQDRLFLNPTIENWVSAHCSLVATFGDYRIYTINRG